MRLNKEELEEKYNSMSNKALCKELNITNPTLSSYLDKLGIERKKRGRKPSIEITEG